MNHNDIEEIAYAKSLLENQSLAMRATDLIGKPLEKGIDQLPKKAKIKINQATNKALQVSLKVATSTMQKKEQNSSNVLHKLATATSGASGGFFGVAALPVELPLSTTIMLRSIMDIARSEGEDIDSVEAQIACVEVFALGGPSINDDAMDTAYFTVRAMLSSTLAEASQHITKHGLSNASAPIIVKLISEISSRFGVQVSQKIILQSIPILGAASGAVINTLFMDHFQNIARGHFIIRRMERTYGKIFVREKYMEV